jgi:F0F1-type ATP synthase assembly protein I
VLTQAASGFLGAAVGVFAEAIFGHFPWAGFAFLVIGFGLACIVAFEDGD